MVLRILGPVYRLTAAGGVEMRGLVGGFAAEFVGNIEAQLPGQGFHLGKALWVVTRNNEVHGLVLLLKLILKLEKLIISSYKLLNINLFN